MIFETRIQVLDFVTNVSKKNGKSYHKLVCYEAGREYPQLTIIEVPEQKVSLAQSLVGETEAMVKVDLAQYKNETRYHLIDSVA